MASRYRKYVVILKTMPKENCGQYTAYEHADVVVGIQYSTFFYIVFRSIQFHKLAPAFLVHFLPLSTYWRIKYETHLSD